MFQFSEYFFADLKWVNDFFIKASNKGFTYEQVHARLRREESDFKCGEHLEFYKRECRRVSLNLTTLNLTGSPTNAMSMDEVDSVECENRFPDDPFKSEKIEKKIYPDCPYWSDWSNCEIDRVWYEMDGREYYAIESKKSRTCVNYNKTLSSFCLGSEEPIEIATEPCGNFC